jgi:hypothetical protein
VTVLTHDHTDDRLTIGCLACIQRARDAERAAELDAAPLRTISVEWSTRVRGTVSLQVKALPGEDADEVADRNHQAIADAIEDAYIDRWASIDIEWDDVQFEDKP